MKTLIIVPAFNEEKSITRVIKDLKKQGFKEIVVIDDGSEDKSGEMAAKEGAIVLRHLVNRGLGAALGTGFAFAKTRKIDALVTFDSDGQHHAKDIKRLLAPLKKSLANVVIGSRFKDLQNAPVERSLANKLANLTTYLFYGVWTTDSQSGFRSFDKKALSVIKIKTDRMEVSSEFFKEIHRNKLKFQEIDIPATYTAQSLKNSKQGNVGISSIKIGYKMLLRIFR